ncbi:MAG: V-type ATP synthase subunit E [Thermoproteus sp.]
MSLFQDLINQHIKELEELKQKLYDDIQNKIKQKSYELLSRYSEEISNVQSQVTLERERILYEALVESRKKTANIYEVILNQVKKDIYDFIDNNRTSDRYIRFLENILIKAKEVIGDDLLVYSSPKDKNTIAILMRKLGLKGEVAERDIIGGLIASSRDGSVKLDMSIESLIESNIDELKRAVLSVL